MFGLNLFNTLFLSMIQSHQQWDYPNGWPPLNHMIIEGLRRSDNKLFVDKYFYKIYNPVFLECRKKHFGWLQNGY